MKNKINKFLLIGWDAADWKIIWPLISKGYMPNLQKMIQEGVYGNMSTMNPPYSPMLWSSVATGKTPDKHGVLGFLEISDDKKLRSVTTRSRKARAVWNILHNKGYRSNVVGWWPSYPAEPINGVVVSDNFQKLNKKNDKIYPLKDGAVHPKEYAQILQDLRMHPSELTKEHILPFIPNAAKIDQSPENKKNGLPAFAQIMSENVSIHNAATHLIKETEWDFMAVYYDYIDHMGHSFMNYHPPKLPRIDTENYKLYNNVINSSYRFQDMMLGRVLSMIDDSTTVVVMSDHGFESGNKRILEMPKVNAAPALDHRQFGIFVAKGPNIKKNEKIFGLSLIDIAPTILNHFNLSVGKDMDGKVILDMYKELPSPKYIDSWENQSGDFGENRDDTEAFSDEETIQQLIDLGYIDKPDGEIEKAINNTKCDLKHNLARVYLGKKDFQSAKKLMLELVEEKDSMHLAHYHIELMNICLALGEIKETEKYLKDFRRIDVDVNFNIAFIESEIALSKGSFLDAENILKAALKKRGNTETLYRLGEVYRLQEKWHNAKECFLNAIEFEPDKPKYNKAMAEVYYSTGDYQEAAEYAFTTIELVKYYPDAHYLLGRALEKLGDLENAKLAFENASKLKPKTFHRAERSLENIEEKLNANKLKDKYKNIFKKDQIVVVSGLPRSGTSLMMQMISKGGIEPLTDDIRQADKSNPKGYFEYEPVMSIHKNNIWLEKGKNKVVKIVGPLLNHLDPKFRYKIIFMTRNLDEIIKSQRIMTGKDPDVMPVSLYNSYVQLLDKIEKWKDEEPSVELIYVDYKDVLNSPSQIIEKVSRFIGVDMRKQSMESCVDKSLYRNRAEKTNI